MKKKVKKVKKVKKTIELTKTIDLRGIIEFILEQESIYSVIETLAQVCSQKGDECFDDNKVLCKEYDWFSDHMFASIRSLPDFEEN